MRLQSSSSAALEGAVVSQGMPWISSTLGGSGQCTSARELLLFYSLSRLHCIPVSCMYVWHVSCFLAFSPRLLVPVDCPCFGSPFIATQVLLAACLAALLMSRHAHELKAPSLHTEHMQPFPTAGSMLLYVYTMVAAVIKSHSCLEAVGQAGSQLQQIIWCGVCTGVWPTPLQVARKKLKFLRM
jgi:hypothetical protein